MCCWEAYVPLFCCTVKSALVSRAGYTIMQEKGIFCKKEMPFSLSFEMHCKGNYSKIIRMLKKEE
ncbi:MAG TPA: hypothetical protein DCS54_04270 [Oribacterium sp.]|nr:hypothetical protein [Oribacterium sp.]